LGEKKGFGGRNFEVIVLRWEFLGRKGRIQKIKNKNKIKIKNIKNNIFYLFFIHVHNNNNIKY